MGRYLTRCLLALGATLFALAASAEGEADSKVLIELSGLETAEGNLFIAVYDSKKTWLGEDTVTQKKVVIT